MKPLVHPSTSFSSSSPGAFGRVATSVMGFPTNLNSLAIMVTYGGVEALESGDLLQASQHGQ